MKKIFFVTNIADETQNGLIWTIEKILENSEP